MLVTNYNDPQTFRRTLMIYGGEAQEGFVHQIKKSLQRYFRQQDRPVPPESALVPFAQVLWKLVEKHGLPKPLEPSDQGQHENMSDESLRARLDEIWSRYRLTDYRKDLEAPARHFVKGIWQPEFKKCRLSYKKTSPSGDCSRQSLDHARGRISGTHCVDCPYWVSVTAVKNERLLTKEWAPESVHELTSNLDVFLPDDYRNLKQLLYMHARFGCKS
jgi:hypothetical protein